MGPGHVLGGGFGRTPRGDAVGARERLPVGRVYVLEGGGGRAPRDAAVGARERLPVGRVYVRERGVRRTLRGASVGTRERRTGGREYLIKHGDERARRDFEMGARKRLSLGLEVANVGEGKRTRRYPGMGESERLTGQPWEYPLDAPGIQRVSTRAKKTHERDSKRNKTKKYCRRTTHQTHPAKLRIVSARMTLPMRTLRTHATPSSRENETLHRTLPRSSKTPVLKNKLNPRFPTRACPACPPSRPRAAPPASTRFPARKARRAFRRWL